MTQRNTIPRLLRGLTGRLTPLVALCLLCAAASARQEQPESQPEQTQPERAQPEQDPLGGLDELLGLEEGSETPPDELPIDPSQRQLDRQLEGEQITEAFVEAARLMSDTADRLEGPGDTGIVTQRLQEDVIKRLDILIEAARSQQQQRRSASPQRSASAGRQQQQRSQEQRPADGENRGQVDPPARQEGPLRPPSAALNATWGALPERVREALRQGQSSGFSSIYRSLTEAYYRRLAEEAGR